MMKPEPSLATLPGFDYGGRHYDGEHQTESSMSSNQTKTTIPRTPPGFVDAFADDVVSRGKMIDTICGVYRRFGFAPLETSAVEYLDVLGKFLPESDEPSGGVFALKDDDDQWVSLRYDLTAPLSRVMAQYSNELPSPYRRYQVGPVWRREKPGPGRFRQFYQCDFDTVGTASVAADAEVCAVLTAALTALGIDQSDFEIRVNNRKVLNGVLETIGVDAEGEQQLTVLRAIDKLDRLGMDGVKALLGEGRKDASGDYTEGAGLSAGQIDTVLGFVGAGEGAGDRDAVCDTLASLVGTSDVGNQGVEELKRIGGLLDSMDLSSGVVKFDPTVVRGLGYYTGPVFEATLTFEITDEKGRKRSFGSVAGGGRYDDLVTRFTGTEVPATGASIGVDRLRAALKALDKIDLSAGIGPVVVTVMDKERLDDYQRMVFELRDAGIPSELYLGSKGFRAQMKYSDKRRAPAVIIAGGDEFEKGEVSIKDMALGTRLAKEIEDRDAWRKGQPAQKTYPRNELVAAVKAILGQ
jgi:histidyl-tRNA synthetase